MSASTFPSLIQRFFTDHLFKQLGASSHTVPAFRDSFRLLLHSAKSASNGHLPNWKNSASFLGYTLAVGRTIHNWDQLRLQHRHQTIGKIPGQVVTVVIHDRAILDSPAHSTLAELIS